MEERLEIVELASDRAIAGAYELMALLRPHLRAETFVQQVRAQQGEGYQLLAGTIAGRLVALAGFRVARTLARGEHLFVDDLVTAPEEQGKGYGKKLLRRLAEIAREKGLRKAWLDSRDTARTFYERVGFRVHTSVPCWIEVDALLGACQ